MMLLTATAQKLRRLPGKDFRTPQAWSEQSCVRPIEPTALWQPKFSSMPRRVIPSRHALSPRPPLQPQQRIRIAVCELGHVVRGEREAVEEGSPLALGA